MRIMEIITNERSSWLFSALIVWAPQEIYRELQWEYAYWYWGVQGQEFLHHSLYKLATEFFLLREFDHDAHDNDCAEQFFVSFVACSNQPNGTSSYKPRQHSASYINGQTGDPKDEIKDNGRSSDFYLKPAALCGWHHH